MGPRDVARWLAMALLAVGLPVTGSAQRRPLSVPATTRDSVMQIMEELAFEGESTRKPQHGE
jgi:hypothetical protein